MRRFVDTVAGKAMCHLAVMALVLPTATLAVVNRAEAQVQQLPSWAVTEFRDIKNGNARYGQAASEAVSSELAKTNRYDVLDQGTVKRSIESLGLTSPLEGIVNLQRVGQDIRAKVIVQGEVLDYQVRAVGGGKQAIVALRVVAYNAQGGLPVNGALERGESTIRSGNVTNEALINDAIAQAAAGAVIKMQSQQLPTATVLNTSARVALINQGARSGFKGGDAVVITRGSVQVATARVGNVEPDQAEISFERIQGAGVAPGDRVDALFNPPPLPAIGVAVIKTNGEINGGRSRPRGRSNNATLISALLVVGLVAVLLSSGNSNGTEATGRFDAEATIALNGNTPGVRLSWNTNGFFKGSTTSSEGVKLWQIYRNLSGPTPTDVPILVVNGGAREAFDLPTNVSSNVAFARFANQNTQTCSSQSLTDSTIPATGVALAPGQPYIYQLEAVYSVLAINLPDGTSGSQSGGGTTTSAGGTTTSAGGNTTSGNNGGLSSGTNGTTTAGGTNTAGGGGTTGGNANTLCYFRSGRSTSGQATPLNKPTPGNPVAGPSLPPAGSTAPSVNFSFTATNTNATIPARYVIEFSDQITFPKGRTVRTEQLITTTRSVDFGDTTLFTTRLRNAPVLFYRIGIRNLDDRPGPVKARKDDQRYIYSNAVRLSRGSTPPSS